MSFAVGQTSTVGIKERFWSRVSSDRWWWWCLFLSLLTEILVTLLMKFFLFSCCFSSVVKWVNVGQMSESGNISRNILWFLTGNEKLSKYSESLNRHWLKDIIASKCPWYFYCSLCSPSPCFRAVLVLFSPFHNLHETCFCWEHFSSGPSQLSASLPLHIADLGHVMFG